MNFKCVPPHDNHNENNKTTITSPGEANISFAFDFQSEINTTHIDADLLSFFVVLGFALDQTKPTCGTLGTKAVSRIMPGPKKVRCSASRLPRVIPVGKVRRRGLAATWPTPEGGRDFHSGRRWGRASMRTKA